MTFFVKRVFADIFKHLWMRSSCVRVGPTPSLLSLQRWKRRAMWQRRQRLEGLLPGPPGPPEQVGRVCPVPSRFWSAGLGENDSQIF